MAVSVFKTFAAGEILTASDLNSSLSVFAGANGQNVGFPRTSSADFDGQELILDSDADTSITADTDDQIDFKLQGQDVFILDGTAASVVNGATFAAAAAGGTPSLTAQGSDANISLNIVAKGTGTVQVEGDSVNEGENGVLASQIFGG
jgi:hypothetical protein